MTLHESRRYLFFFFVSLLLLLVVRVMKVTSFSCARNALAKWDNKIAIWGPRARALPPPLNLYFEVKLYDIVCRRKDNVDFMLNTLRDWGCKSVISILIFMTFTTIVNLYSDFERRACRIYWFIYARNQVTSNCHLRYINSTWHLWQL